MRSLALLLLFAAAAPAAEPPPVPLRDLKPSGGSVRRSRTAANPGLFVGGRRYRGLCTAGRVAFALNGDFARFRVEVGVLDGNKDAIQFEVLGDGKKLFGTPPLFPGEPPRAVDVDVTGVKQLVLATRGARGRVAWIDGRLVGAAGANLSAYRATDVSFSPAAYPQSFKRRVNEAIDASAKYLWSRQQPNGTWNSHRQTLGATALVTLALLKSGVPADDPRIARAFSWMRGQRYSHVYSVSILLMAIEARHFPRGATPKEAAQEIPADDIDWIRAASSWLATQQGAGYPPKQRALHPVWRYPHGGYDLSNTQYALFGLSAAARCGVTHRDVWIPCLRFLLGAQERDGPVLTVSRYFKHGRYVRRRTERAQARGFGYVLEREPTGAMTSAGLCSLVLCEAALEGTRRFAEKYRKRTREGIRDALAWLEEYYAVDENPFAGSWWAYYLFNLERAGVLLDQRYLGTRDWYEEGSEALIERQSKKTGAVGSLVDTSFALLFWKRATVAPITQSGRR